MEKYTKQNEYYTSTNQATTTEATYIPWFVSVARLSGWNRYQCFCLLALEKTLVSLREISWMGSDGEIPRGRFSEPTRRGIGMGGVVMEVKGAVECSCVGGGGVVWSSHATTRTTLS